ncbi:unnamed protein product [Amoebophrya sp. A120]|nr:unnamed protein product [Amoebophrya sp. A120]|eukprot:GSA120T00023107001.1
MLLALLWYGSYFAASATSGVTVVEAAKMNPRAGTSLREGVEPLSAAARKQVLDLVDESRFVAVPPPVLPGSSRLVRHKKYRDAVQAASSFRDITPEELQRDKDFVLFLIKSGIREKNPSFFFKWDDLPDELRQDKEILLAALHHKLIRDLWWDHDKKPTPPRRNPRLYPQPVCWREFRPHLFTDMEVVLTAIEVGAVERCGNVPPEMRREDQVLRLAYARNLSSN